MCADSSQSNSLAGAQSSLRSELYTEIPIAAVCVYGPFVLRSFRKLKIYALILFLVIENFSFTVHTHTWSTEQSAFYFVLPLFISKRSPIFLVQSHQAALIVWHKYGAVNRDFRQTNMTATRNSLWLRSMPVLSICVREDKSRSTALCRIVRCSAGMPTSNNMDNNNIVAEILYFLTVHSMSNWLRFLLFWARPLRSHHNIAGNSTNVPYLQIQA